MKNKKGITLIALVITIIVLLILAGISLSLVLGENGILKKAQDGVTNHGKATIAEQIKLAYAAYEMAKANGEKETAANFIKNRLKNELGIDDDDIRVEESDGDIIVTTNDGKNYKLDDTGNVTEIQVYIDSTPGVLALNENNEYMVESIEDLVAFSAMVNGGYSNGDITIEANDFSGKKVVLARSLDFNEIFSYVDYTTRIYSGYLANGASEMNLLSELTKEEYKGFVPIGTSAKKFKGSFNGNNHYIKNLYVQTNTEGNGLFGYAENSTIENLAVTGKIIGTGDCGGIVGNITGNVINCINKCEINANYNAGGITGRIVGACMISDCYNYGNVSIITSGEDCAGIVGTTYYGTGRIKRCINAGKITGGSNKTGGITGSNWNWNYIENCINLGEVTCIDGNCGSMVGYSWNGNIYDCCNFGDIHAMTSNKGYVGGIIGWNGQSNVYNSFSVGTVSGNTKGGIAAKNTGTVSNSSYYTVGGTKPKTDFYTESFIVNTLKWKKYTTLENLAQDSYACWCINENDRPTLYYESNIDKFE